MYKSEKVVSGDDLLLMCEAFDEEMQHLHTFTEKMQLNRVIAYNTWRRCQLDEEELHTCIQRLRALAVQMKALATISITRAEETPHLH
jgi:hypothetical protein